MRNLIYILSISCILIISQTKAQDTFSICAVDTVTGEVGSAGASCLDESNIHNGVLIISDVHPGRGVIHTQSYWRSENQENGRYLMNLGYEPKEILDTLLLIDSDGDSTIRQYGIVGLYGGMPKVKAYTGVNCMDWKGHIEGRNYSIQGNILLGKFVLDSMEERFLRAKGDLACKLMEAMQGAKFVGADTRCTPSGNSSLSSFLRVAKPNDVAGKFYLELIVPKGPKGYEPIDSLQKLFDKAHICQETVVQNETSVFSIEVSPNPTQGTIFMKFISKSGNTEFSFQLFDYLGRLMKSENMNTNTLQISCDGLSGGIYFYRISDGEYLNMTGMVYFE
ncbi:MAG: secretion protein [Ignavibacteria bacterium]|nr:secretion protein [Ignavibacteria bacterium]